MSKLNIYVRQDLKMRKGKMAAQSAHAAQKLLIEAMSLKDDLRILKEPQAREFFEWSTGLRKVDIHMVKDIQDMDSRISSAMPYSKIIDSGRTEFAGVPTLTCAAQGIFSSSISQELVVPKNIGSEIKAKQLFVFSKEHTLSKQDACELAVVGCLGYHATLMKEIVAQHGQKAFAIDVDPNTEFGMWVGGAFAKIALGIPTDDGLYALEEKLKGAGIKSLVASKENNLCLIIEPKVPANIDPYTSHLGLI